MKRTLALMAVAAALLATTGTAQAGGGRYYGGARVVINPGFYGGWYGGYGYRPYWGGVGLGVTIAAPLYYPYRYGPYYDGGWVAPAPAPLVYAQPVPPAAPVAPAPTLAPRNGQSAAQTEIDRRACDRWAVSQPAAMADAQVFHRITLACMDARGYTAR
jgi:hypothetical protein